MADVSELIDRRDLGIDEGNGVVKTHTRELVVENATGETDAYNSIQASAESPATLTVLGKLLVRTNIDLRETDDITRFFATVTWEQADRDREEPKDRPVGFEEFSFDLSRPRTPIRMAVGGDAGQTVFGGGDKNGGFVNVIDGVPEGVVYDGQGQGVSIKTVLANATVDHAYLRTLKGLLGKRNDAVFRTHPAKTLVFDSVRGDLRNNQAESWDVTFNFLLGEALNNENVAGIAGVSADPHDYVESIMKLDKDGKVKAHRVIVSQLFEDGDYTNLGI